MGTGKTDEHGGSICRRRRRSATPGAERAPFCRCFSEASATAPVYRQCRADGSEDVWTVVAADDDAPRRSTAGGGKRRAKSTPELRNSPPPRLPSSTPPTRTPMAAPIPSPSALRALRASIAPYTRHTQQVRHATLLRRPKRPYTFTQLITLSDGSAFTVRTTNPQPVLKSAKDIRNNPLWHPSSQKLLNVEEDEAGKLAAFRAKFGTAWDSESDKVRGRRPSMHRRDVVRSGLTRNRARREIVFSTSSALRLRKHRPRLRPVHRRRRQSLRRRRSRLLSGRMGVLCTVGSVVRYGLGISRNECRLQMKAMNTTFTHHTCSSKDRVVSKTIERIVGD